MKGLDPAALARRTGTRPGGLRGAQAAPRGAARAARADARGDLRGAASSWRARAAWRRAMRTSRSRSRRCRRICLRRISEDYTKILERHDLERYVEIFYYAEQLHPDDPFLNQLLGATFLRLKRWKDAVPYLEKAAEARPNDVNYQSNLVFAYEQSGRYADALDALGSASGARAAKCRDSIACSSGSSKRWPARGRDHERQPASRPARLAGTGSDSLARGGARAGRRPHRILRLPRGAAPASESLRRAAAVDASVRRGSPAVRPDVRRREHRVDHAARPGGRHLQHQDARQDLVDDPGARQDLRRQPLPDRIAGAPHESDAARLRRRVDGDAAR